MEEAARGRTLIVLALDERAALTAELDAQRLVAPEPLDRAGQRLRVVGGDEQARLAITHELGDPGDGTADHGPARRHRLHEHGRDAVHVAGVILAARHDDGMAGAHLPCDLLLGDGAGEDARTAVSQRAAARAFGVTARSRACDQGFFPAARCSAPRVRRTAMGRASSIRRAPARIPVSTSAGVNTPAGRRRANVPCRSAVAPRYSGTMNTSCPASWTSIISFTTNGCEGAGGKAGITYAMRMPGSHPSGRRASRDGGLPAGMRENAGSDRERRAAAAGVRGLRVRELEAAAVEARHEVDLGADEVLGAARIDQDLDPVVLEHLVALARVLVEAELVAEPRAPAPHHRNPVRVRLRDPLLRPHLLHHLDRPGREDERRACLLAHARTIETQPRKVNAMRRAAPAGQRSLPIFPIVRHCETP